MLRAGRIPAARGSALRVPVEARRVRRLPEREFRETGARGGAPAPRIRLLLRVLFGVALLVVTISGTGFMLAIVRLSPLGNTGPFNGLSALFAPPSDPCPPAASAPRTPTPAGATATSASTTAAPAAATVTPTKSTAAAAAPCAKAPPAAKTGGVPYAHSWYVTSPETIESLATGDAKWLNAQSMGSTCGRDFLTVLDFAHPMRASVGNASPLDDYAMSLFRHPGAATYRDVERIAARYLDAWIAAASNCPRLHLVLGTSNFSECRGGVSSCDVYTAGQYWDVVAHDVMDYVASKGYGGRITGVWVGDDLETSWDPWPTTRRFLQGVRDQEHTYATHAQLINYGDANVGACSIVTGNCRAPWTPQNVYDAAWGLGWALPLPETYNTTTTQLWDSVAHTQGGPNPMIFAGVMTECAGPDPLPAGPCRPQGGGVTGRGSCEWSPTIAIAHVQKVNQAVNTAGLPLPASDLFATNMQWPPGSSGNKTSGTPCG